MKKQRLISAVVTSNKKFKEGTLTVAVKRQKRHPLYKKVMHMVKKYIVDYPSKESIEVGETVQIASCAPRSKTKHFEVIQEEINNVK